MSSSQSTFDMSVRIIYAPASQVDPTVTHDDGDDDGYETEPNDTQEIIDSEQYR